MTEKRKAIALLSGGLDSRLAVKMILDQGVEVEAVNFVTLFCTCTSKSSCKSEARKASEEFGIKLKTLNATEELMEAVRNARHGYGRGLNPCLDCRVNMFRKAGEYMRQSGGDFIVTGEVWGERPMSQRPAAMKLIEKESGLEGLIVRPLSAFLFEPSLPEQRGWVNREKFMAIEGRSRKPQMQLAAEIGVVDYPCPAGGCLLCEKNFAARLKSLLEVNPRPSAAEIQMLKLGRIFFSSQGARIFIPRSEDETRRLEELAQPGDVVMNAVEATGPTTLIKGSSINDLTIKEAAALTARYGRQRQSDSVLIRYFTVNSSGPSAAKEKKIITEPAEGWKLAKSLARQ